MYDDDPVIARLVFITIGIFAVILVSLVLMIPFLNIYIAYKLFGED